MLFAIHPNVYHTNPSAKGLLHMLEQAWVRRKTLGNGTIYIISGFANFNGGVRFYNVIEDHIKRGGKCIVYFGGSTSQRLSSSQVVEKLLQIGCEVHIINRKRILHAKCYGFESATEDTLVISSGNFTGPGMSQNIEASFYLENNDLKSVGFSWTDLIKSIQTQKWDIYQPSLKNKTHPSWKLLYDEVGGTTKLDIDQEMTMVVTLSHSDTVRIGAKKGTNASKGTQYFWLSKDSYDFFPALNVRNNRGSKNTYSAIINMNYKDLNIIDKDCRVTFEADNNLDFRLGTGKLRYSNIANEGDLAAITRISEYDYELRIFKKNSDEFNELLPYAVTYIGAQGKRYGYIPNDEFYDLI